MRTAQIAFDNAKRELERNEKLFKQGVVAEAELQKFRTELRAAPSRSSTTASVELAARQGRRDPRPGKASTLSSPRPSPAW